MALLNAYYYVQAVNTALAVFLNFSLVFLVCRYSNNQMGKYRYLVITFATFEATYATVVFLGMPINFVADRSWMVFTHSSFLGSIDVLGPALYCTFYEIWLGFVVVHFLYRYIVMCRPKLASWIAYSVPAKIALVAIWVIFIVFTMFCGLFFCTRLTMSQHMANLIRQDFGIADSERVGYILLRKRDPQDGSISFAGTTAILNHFFLVSVSCTIIIFCGIRVWSAIQKMKEDSQFLRDHTVQLQMFATLVIQTLVPVLFCQIPSFIYLSFPFWETDLSFGEYSLVFSVLTSISKWIDPLIVMLCIREYREALFRLCGGGKPKDLSRTSSDHPLSRNSIKFTDLQHHIETQNL